MQPQIFKANLLVFRCNSNNYCCSNRSPLLVNNKLEGWQVIIELVILPFIKSRPIT